MQESFIVRILTDDNRLEHVPPANDHRFHCAGNYPTYTDALDAIEKLIRVGSVVDDERFVILSTVRVPTPEKRIERISQQADVIRRYVDEAGQVTGTVSGQMVLSALDVIMELASDQETRSKQAQK